MKTIKINAIQFSDIIGHETCSILLCEEPIYYPGDEVEVVVYSINDNVPTGAKLKRFVVDVEYLSVSRDEDSYFRIKLSALRPSLPTTNSSEDNEESFPGDSFYDDYYGR